MKTTVSELGEFPLIERLRRYLSGRGKPAALPDPLIAIGDDAAVWRGDGVAIATTDTVVEGVHFVPEVTPWRDLGWKALAVNVSDIGAMGGTPEYALVTLALPADLPVADVDALYEGLAAACAEYGVMIVGGDIVRSPVAVITVALWGRGEVDAEGRPLLLKRSAAQAGDAVAVSGTLGDSGGGLRLILGQGQAEGEVADTLKSAHLRPQPPVSLGRLAVREGVRAGMDVSDGLLRDLGHIAEESRLGAIVRADAVPTSEALRTAFPADALALACAGGEDYQLLLTAPPSVMDRLMARSEVPLTVIGEMVDDPQTRVRLLDAAGNEIILPTPGWDHFAKRT